MNIVKNVIFFVGDGMGYIIIIVMCILDGQMKGYLGEENVLSWEIFLWLGQVKIYNVDMQGVDLVVFVMVFMNGIKIFDSKWIEVELYEMMLC